MAPSVTSSQICCSFFDCRSGSRRLHSERFIAFRASFTSSITNHEAGATLLYQGHLVLFE